MRAAQRQQIVERYAELLPGTASEVSFDQSRRETVEAGGHRRAGGEEIARSRHGQGDLEGLSARLQETVRAFRHGERHMPFIQVAEFGLDAGHGGQLIAGRVAKPARADRQVFARHEFHAGIRNAAQRELRMGLLQPRGRRRSIPPRLHQIVNVFAESRIGWIMLRLFPRNGVQDHPGGVRELPQNGIRLAPYRVGGVVPRRTPIERKRGRGIKPLHVRG